MRLPQDYLSRKGYRLPTEAEWEYACRAGTATSRYYGSGEELLGRYAWYLGNSKDRAWPGGSRKPNDFGLFDMLGNAMEWCGEPLFRYRLTSARKNSEDLESGLILDERQGRALRGASFPYAPASVRSACRNWFAPSNRNSTVGVRLARTYP